MFAEHCLEHYTLRDVVDMFYSGEKDHLRVQFDLSEEEWQDAVYVVIKKMGTTATGQW